MQGCTTPAGAEDEARGLDVAWLKSTESEAGRTDIDKAGGTGTEETDGTRGPADS